jgi:signal transduction histidine kinase
MRKIHDNFLQLGFGIALLILIFIGGMVYWTTHRLIRTNSMALDTSRVVENLNKLQAAIYKGESSARGFLMSEDPDDLDNYRSSISEIQQTLQALEDTFTNNPPQKERFLDLEPLVEKKIESGNRKIELRMAEGYNSALAELLAERDQILTDDIAATISKMKAEEIRLLNSRRTDSDRNANYLLVSLTFGLAVSLCTFLAIYYYLNHEVSLRRQAEAEAMKLNESLERRVRERTTQLADVNQQLELRNREVEHANRMKSEFLTRMSHELRTPLNAIIGFSDLMAEESAGPLNEKQKRFIQHVSAGARHLLQLINDVLDVSKIEAGKIEFHPEDFIASDAISEVLSVITPLADSKEIRVENRVGNEWALRADRIRIKQILYNLLTNAVKFTAEGGRVCIEAFRETKFVRFCVSDTGIGIPPDEQRMIFEEFHQVGGTTKDPNQGTGLGLTITKKLVELHGGRIWVESNPSRGSSFSFTIPAADES